MHLVPALLECSQLAPRVPRSTRARVAVASVDMGGNVTVDPSGTDGSFMYTGEDDLGDAYEDHRYAA